MEIELSPTKIFAFESCPRQFYMKYVRKAYPPKKLEEHMHLGSLVHKALELLSNYPVYENIEKCVVDSVKELEVVVTTEMMQNAVSMIQTWFSEEKFTKFECLATEHQFLKELDKNIAIKGIIDRVERVSDKTVRVIDYKTGGRIYTEDEMRDSNQLVIYAMAAYDEFPAENILIRYDMIMHNRVAEVLVRKDDYAKKYEYLKEIYQRITSGEKEPIMGRHCAYCWYKYNCTEYVNYLKDVLKVENIEDIMTGNFEDSLIHIQELDDKRKVLDTHISEIKSHIMNEMLSAGQTKVTHGKFELSVITPKKRTYDVGVVLEIFKDRPEDVLRSSKRAVDRLMGPKSVEEKARLISTAKEVEGASYLKISEKK